MSSDIKFFVQSAKNRTQYQFIYTEKSKTPFK